MSHTSRSPTPWWHQLSSIHHLRPHCDTQSNQCHAWCGVICGITRDFLILLCSDFCYKKSPVERDRQEANFTKITTYIIANLPLYAFYIIVSANSPTASSSKCSMGGCSSGFVLGFSVFEFGMTEIVISGEPPLSSIISNFLFNSLLFSFDM